MQKFQFVYDLNNICFGKDDFELIFLQQND